MKKNFQCRLYSLLLLAVFIIAASRSATAADGGAMMAAVSELIVTNKSQEPVEIESLSLEQAHKAALRALEEHDTVIEYEASISAPDKRLICTPFLCEDFNSSWRFLILYQAGPTSRVVGYNLSNDEFRDIVEDLYQTSMYHFNEEEL